MKRLRRYYAFAVIVIVFTAFIVVSCVVLMIGKHFELLNLFVSLFILLACAWLIVFIYRPTLCEIIKLIKEEIDKIDPTKIELKKTLDEMTRQVEECKITVDDLSRHSAVLSTKKCKRKKEKEESQE